MTTPDPEALTSDRGAFDHVLVFTLDGREFALPVRSVVEIVRHRAATPVPRCSPSVEGIIPVRGQMVTVLDVRKCLALPPRPVGTAAQVIVVGSLEDRLGLVVDDVSGVVRVPSSVPLLDVGALMKGVS